MSASRTVTCLLRNDLRLHDDEVFHWAQRNADHIIPLYCFDPRHYQGTYHFNFPKTGPFRLRFLLDSVKDLRATLKKRGSTMLVRQGKLEEVVSDLIQQLGSVTAVAFHEEVASEEKSVEKNLKDICCQNKVKVQTFWGSTLYHRDDLPFSHIRGLNIFLLDWKRATSRHLRPWDRQSQWRTADRPSQAVVERPRLLLG
uniref:Cryptochrome DASH transcript variant X2 n=1 Tax=Garra andruzzii TaxID=472297 RepID=A0A3G2JQB0_9TELE|nr:cryptochrome DASH transcript variant X2 [Garra andruzzii]